MSFILSVGENQTEFNDSIQSELAEVKKLIHVHTRSKFKDVQKIVTDVMQNEGKMLRPYLVILGANFGRYERERHVKLAGAVEILHMATLVHDDIIDEAKLRRNQASIQSKYGKDMAVYTGDYLLSKSISILNGDSFNAENSRRLSEAIAQICESELMQYQNRFRALSIKNYLRVISGKTAALFAVSLYVGAVESGCDENLSKMLGRIGYELGMAFQIIDDILDFDINQSKVGKSTMSDFINGYYTIPILLALQKGTGNVDSLSKEAMMDFVKANRGLDSARELAHKYTERAFKRIDLLPDCDAKAVLNLFAKKLVDREY